MLLDIKKDKIIVEILFDLTHIRLFKTIPGKRWNSDKKVWIFPLTRDNFWTLMKSIPFTLTEEAKEWSKKHAYQDSTSIIFRAEPPEDYTFKTEPYKHQIVAFNYLRDRAYAGLFMDMGTGKTKVIIDILSDKAIKDDINKVLIMAPNSVLESWESEIKKHSSIDNYDITLLRGTKNQRIKALDPWKFEDTSKLHYIIINYEGCSVVFKELLYHNFDVVICDESTRIKNPRATRSKRAFDLGLRAKYKYILTGQPITKSYVDLFGQYKFLDHTIFGKNQFIFKNKYCIMGGYMGKEIVAYQNMDDLQDKVFNHSIRFTKEECLDLPEKIYTERRFDMAEEQGKSYKEMAKQLITWIDETEVSASVVITKLIKLSQICSGFALLGDEKGPVRFDKNPKLDLFEELLGDIGKNQAIVWCHFREEVRMVCKLLDKLKIPHGVLTGDVPPEDRAIYIKEFQEDKRQFIVGTTATGGMGITLTAAKYVIYFSNDYSLENRLQSEDRAHRIGQTSSVTYIDLIARGTLEERILKILKGKKTLADAIMEQGVKEII